MLSVYISIRANKLWHVNHESIRLSVTNTCWWAALWETDNFTQSCQSNSGLVSSDHCEKLTYSVPRSDSGLVSSVVTRHWLWLLSPTVAWWAMLCETDLLSPIVSWSAVLLDSLNLPPTSLSVETLDFYSRPRHDKLILNWHPLKTMHATHLFVWFSTAISMTLCADNAGTNL